MPNNWRIITTKPARTSKKNSSDQEIVKEILTEYELIIDSYEQAIERPQKYEKQKEYYSGKKKNHKRKSQVILLPLGKNIVDIEAGKPGKKSDINFFRETQQRFSPKQKFTGDQAYLGEPAIKTPKKKPKNQELSSQEKFRSGRTC
ncbi:transposase family protein [Dapis sp. BLCC M229]|uniref:transposase family protein n=1 Tax=Dapis sp. BLCC M229 TaxID=3400188 RepID=UPI003CEC48AF